MQVERDRPGGLGRSLRDVLADHAPRPEREPAVFDAARPEHDRLDDALDALAAGFPADVVATCLHRADDPAVVRVRGELLDDGEAWALADVLRAAVAGAVPVLVDHTATGAAVLAAPAGDEGAVGVLRRAGAFDAGERRLVESLARMASR